MRYESAIPNARGHRVGVFALANGLAHAGRLTTEEWLWWRAANDWLDAAFPDPAAVEPTLFDRTVHPLVSCWFSSSAEHLLERVPGYLSLLDRYGIGWAERRSRDPGIVLYSDDWQVVVAPHTG